MRDKFATLEEPKSRMLAGLFIAIVALGLVFLFQQSGQMRPISGVVESSGAISVGRIGGGTRETASVRLADGRLVFASVAAGGPLSPGDSVSLIEERQSLGGAAFEVVAKKASHEP